MLYRLIFFLSRYLVVLMMKIYCDNVRTVKHFFLFWDDVIWWLNVTLIFSWDICVWNYWNSVNVVSKRIIICFMPRCGLNYPIIKYLFFWRKKNSISFETRKSSMDCHWFHIRLAIKCCQLCWIHKPGKITALTFHLTKLNNIYSLHAGNKQMISSNEQIYSISRLIFFIEFGTLLISSAIIRKL